MNAQGPIFIDQFGTGPGRPGGPGPNDPIGVWWKDGWLGRMELWRAFWVCFVAGHGIVGGVGFGLMIVSMVVGFAFDPGSLDTGITGLVAGVVVLVAAYSIFAVWASIGVWRCADNCFDKRWGMVARVVMIFYGTCLVLPFAPWLIGRSS
ncbi:MAG: hypothetical protein HOH04_13340 [Rhodospirillaceae bacterium]|nr:hypothetical protein [Rhodospirillaceae bacterium]